MGVDLWRRKDCRRCGVRLTLDNKYGSLNGAICKECFRTTMRERDPKKRHSYWIRYSTQNRERVTDIARKSRLKLKREVLSHYSGGKVTCARCGYSDIRSLGLDHINGDGAVYRRRGLAGNGLYQWLKKEGFPSGLQVLCMNCDWVKRTENGEMYRPKGP
jgi:hypothetical protein